MYEEKIINFKSTNSCKSIAEFTVALLSFFFFTMCLVAQLGPTLLQPHGWQPARLLCPWGFSRQEY